MAKNKIILDVEVNDKGGTKKLGVESKKTAKNLDNLGNSSRTADRNIKGAAQASSGASKNFSKMAQGAGGLVGVYATLAATAFAVSAAFNFLKSAMDFSNLLEGQKALGAVTGVAYKTISDSLVEATNGQLKYAEAAKAAAIGTASGISPSQLARLGAAAKNASLALGRDLGDSFDRLIRGVTKAEPELLDELGIILRLENATRKYGQQIGKSKDELNEFERSQAVANEVLEQAERKFGAMEKMMDPTAHSLNQFAKSFDDIINTIKSGIAGPLAVVAEFLSNSMLALTGAVTLFAGGLLKQVLPSMADWKASSQATAAQVKRDQKAVQLRLERTRRSYAKLKAAQMDSHKAAKQGASKILKGTTGGTKSGAGALDYLRGDTSSKKSRAAAKKAIKHADDQIKNSAKKRTGILKNMNAKQVADLKRSYKIRGAIHKKGMTDFKFHLKQGGFAIKSFKMQLKSMATSAKAAFATLGSAAATAGKVIGKAFFWLSMLSIAFDAIKAIKDHFFPATEAAQKLTKQNEELADKYSTLADEIERTNTALKDHSLLSIGEGITARGNAAGSIDAMQIIKDVNKMSGADKSAGGYEEAKKGLLETARAAANLDSEYKVLVTALENGTAITDKQKKSLINYSNALQQSKINLEQLPSKVNAANAEMIKLVGTIEKPFGTDLISANRELAVSSQKAADDHIASMKKIQEETSFNKRDEDDFVRKLREGGAAIRKYEEQAKNATALADALEAKQERVNKLIKDQSDATANLNKNKTLGLTTSDKLFNIGLQEQVLAKSVNDELVKKEVLLSSKAVLEAKKELSAEEKTQLANLNIQIEQQNTIIDIEQSKVDLEGKSLERKKALLRIAETISGIESRNLANLNAQTQAQRQLNFAKAGGTGTYGIARGIEVAEGTQNKRLTDLAVARNKAEAARAKWNDLMSRKHSTSEYVGATSAMDSSDAAVKNLEQEIALYNDRYAIAMLNVKKDTESARLKAESISMNPAMTAFNIKMNELKAQNIYYNEQEQAFLYAEIQAQTLLNKMAEQKQALFDGIAGAMNNAFQSIVTGTASAKQAFATMAISILSQISQMIIQMMVMRMLMMAFGGPMGAITPIGTPGASAAPHAYTDKVFGRTGGVFSNGKTMQGYAAGGVARGSTSGYPAMLHGTEAVVPLPNGRSIPVEMKDSGATNNNIVVNVSTDGQTSREGSTGPDMDKLGGAIAQAVQVELQNQKRSGGILNPYGVA